MRVRVTRRWVRRVALGLIGACAILGGLAIYEDFPQSSAPYPGLGFIQYACPRGASIDFSGSPMTFQAEINNDNTGYTGSILLLGWSIGLAPCQIQLFIPPDARNVTGATVKGNFAYAKMPLRRGDQPQVVLVSYTSRSGVQRTGWGRYSFSIRFENPFTGPPWQPMPNHVFEGQQVGLTLEVDAPATADTVTSVSPSAQVDQIGTRTTWPLPPGTSNASFSVVYENSTIRFFADHAVDLEVLLVGALLGVVLASQENQARPAGPINSTSAPTPSAPSIGAHAHGATTEPAAQRERARLRWLGAAGGIAFAAVLASSVRLLRAWRRR
jgi:hypothetical protein